jgi:hypothetical protein
MNEFGTQSYCLAVRLFYLVDCSSMIAPVESAGGSAHSIGTLRALGGLEILELALSQLPQVLQM